MNPQVLQAIIASLVVQGALQKRVKSEKDFNVYQNQLTVMMNITMNVIYISLANIPTFFAEKVVCVSEQAEGLYSGLAYLLASTVSSIPVAAVSILAGTLIQYLITGPDPVYYRWYLFPEVLPRRPSDPMPLTARWCPRPARRETTSPRRST